MNNKKETVFQETDAVVAEWSKDWDGILADAVAVELPDSFETAVVARYTFAMARRCRREFAWICLIWSILIPSSVLFVLTYPGRLITTLVWMARGFQDIAWTAARIWHTGPLVSVVGLTLMWVATLLCAGLLTRVVHSAHVDEISAKLLRTHGQNA